MTTRKQFRRALALALTLCGAFAGLGYRLVDLQVLRHGQLATVAEQSAEHEFWEAPRRGDILDIHGNPLGTSVSVETVCADPSAMRGEQALVARTIAPLLRMNDADVYPRLFPVVGRDRGGLLVTNHLYYAPLCKDVSEDTWKKIHLAMQNLRVAGSGRAFDLSLYELRHEAIFAEPSQMRVYPNGALAAQVLGFCTMKDVDMEGHVISQMAGRDGIEAALNPVLTGVAGWQVAGMDGNRRELIPMRDEDVQPRDGLNVVLTIDSVIQHIVESALADAMQKHSPLDATAIVVRPQTGEILALASLPAYDPNHLNTVTTKTRDRVITDVMEPGSTFKIVTVSGALNDGVVHLNDVFDCHHGSCVFFGRTLHDAEPLGMLTTEEILGKSSNIGAVQIGIRLGADRLYHYATEYGFGERTGIPLPGEVAGILYPVKDWSKLSLARIPMGQGVAVTRLQMVMAMAAIANGGWLMRPMLVSRLEDRNGNVAEQYRPQPMQDVVSPATDREMVEALKTVVSPGGTAAAAAMKDYVVAGKTGTAQKAEKGVYAPGKYIASFIGFFPADHPQLCVSVVMDEPKGGYYGGEVCAPVFKTIAERCASYLNITPERSIEAQPLVASGAR